MNISPVYRDKRKSIPVKIRFICSDNILLGQKQHSAVSMLDPSQLLRPERVYDDKPVDAFRDYSVDDEDPIKQRVRKTYYTMHTNVTVDLVKRQLIKNISAFFLVHVEKCFHCGKKQENVS